MKCRLSTSIYFVSATPQRSYYYSARLFFNSIYSFSFFDTRGTGYFFDAELCFLNSCVIYSLYF